MRLQTPNARRRQRGSTLLEAMIAGSLLALGMTGALVLLQASSNTTRAAVVSSEAVDYTNALLDQLSARGYCALSAAGPPSDTTSYDGGTVVDASGRAFPRSYSYSLRAPALTVAAANVVATTLWQDNLGANRRTVISATILRGPDAGTNCP